MKCPGTGLRALQTLSEGAWVSPMEDIHARLSSG